MISHVALSLLVLVAGPQQQAQEPRESGLVEEVEVSLVQRTIFAFDQDGRPVTDLKAEEIVVRDEGKRYDVAFLDPRDLPADEAALKARVILDAPGGPTEPVEAGRREASYFVVLLDLVNRPAFGRAELKEQIRRFIGSSFRHEELVSVVSYSGDMNMELPFTNDVTRLEEAIDTAYARKVASMADPNQRIRNLIRRIDLCRNEDPDGLVICVQQLSQSYRTEAESAARRFLTFLQGGVRYAAGLDGRKAVIVVSQGGPVSADLETRAAIATVFGTDLVGYSEQEEGAAMDGIIREANEGDVVLHFVSVPPMGASDKSAAGGFVPGQGIGVEPVAIAYRSASQGMTVIAKDTGGRHVTTSSVDSGMSEIVDIERGGYTLGYYVDQQLKPDKFRRVRLKCTRPGVDIVAARGYVPPAPEGGEIGLQVKLLGFQPTDDELYRVPFRLQADPRQIGYKMKGGEAIANFTVETTVKRPGGRTLVRTFNFLNHAYDKKSWKAAEIEPVVLEGFIEVPEGEYELHVVLRNSKNARTGRSMTPVRLVRR